MGLQFCYSLDSSLLGFSAIRGPSVTYFSNCRWFEAPRNVFDLQECQTTLRCRELIFRQNSVDQFFEELCSWCQGFPPMLAESSGENYVTLLFIIVRMDSSSINELFLPHSDWFLNLTKIVTLFEMIGSWIWPRLPHYLNTWHLLIDLKFDWDAMSFDNCHGSGPDEMVFGLEIIK